MKRRNPWKCLLVVLLVFVLSGCDMSATSVSDVIDEETTESNDIIIDYPDADSLVAALNDSQDVVNKVVRFCVDEYKTGNESGNICYVGEYLRFVSEDEIDVKSGDYIVGCITNQPTKVWRSWKIPYSVVYVEGDEIPTQSVTPTVSPTITPLPESTFTPTSTPTPTVTSTPIPMPTPTSTSTPSPTPTPEETEATTETSEEAKYTKCSASDLKVSYVFDYAHLDPEYFPLGNDEGFTIIISTEKTELTYDDLVVWYDEEMVSVSFLDPFENGPTKELRIYVKGLEEGESTVIVATAYDYVTCGDEAECYSTTIHKLDSSKGRVVYVTSTGEKYHYSKSCAGSGAIATTYYDAIACGYEACKKCAD